MEEEAQRIGVTGEGRQLRCGRRADWITELSGAGFCVSLFEHQAAF